MRRVDIAPDSSLAAGARADEKVDGTIEIGTLENVVYVGRPVGGKANSDGSLFKVINNGKEAERVKVKFGRASVNTIEILSGLQAGDTVILSDMSNYDKVDGVPLK
jgi:multidrug efflux pump subunit AcrA (membrane-fusion protein)